MLEEKALSTIKRLNMISFNDKILVGVSGGPDSISLLWFLLSLKKEYNLSIYVAHLNHMLRGRESDEDAEFVKKAAIELKLAYKVEKCNINAYSKNYSLSIEEAAREYRYKFYSDSAKYFHASKIALGHSADDQGETVLMRMIRGCGLEGLKGIPAMRDNIIRPLIECTRDEIEHYCRKYQLKYRIDFTNKEPVYFRNKIRLELLPLLSREYNENIKDHLLKLGNIASEVSEYLQKETDAAFRKVLIKEMADRIIINLEKLNDYPLAIKRNIIRESIQIIKGNLNDITFWHIHQIENMTNHQSGEKGIDLPKGLKIKKRYNELIIFKKKQDADNQNDLFLDWEYKINIPGNAKIETLGMRVETKILDASSIEPLNFYKNQYRDRKFSEFVDLEKIRLPLKIRNWRFGDKFFPLNMNGSKKVKEFFIDRKIPKDRRNSIPILVDNEGKIIWIIGFRLDNRVKIQSNTKKILFIKISVSGQN